MRTDDTKQFGNTAEKSLSDLQWNKYLTWGLAVGLPIAATALMPSAAPIMLQGASMAAQYMTGTDNQFVSDTMNSAGTSLLAQANKLLPENYNVTADQISQTATALAPLGYAALGTAAYYGIAKPFMERRKARIVKSLEDTIQDGQTSLGIAEKSNQEMLHKIGKQRQDTKAGTIKDLENMARISKGNNAIREDTLNKSKTITQAHHDVSTMLNVIQGATGNIPKATLLNGIQNPTLRTIINGLEGDNVAPDTAKNAILNAFPDHIAAITDNSSNYTNVKRYYKHILGKARDPELQRQINIAYNQPGATVESMRNYLLGQKPEGIAILAAEAASRTGATASSVFDVIGAYAQDPNIIKIAQKASEATGATAAITRDVVIAALNETRKNANVTTLPISEEMEALPSNVFEARTTDKALAKGQEFTGNVTEANNAINQVIGYKISALEAFGQDVYLDDLTANGDAIAMFAMNKAAAGTDAASVKDGILKYVRDPKIRQAATVAAATADASANSVRDAVLQALNKTADLFPPAKLAEIYAQINDKISLEHGKHLEEALSIYYGQSDTIRADIPPILKKFETLLKQEYKAGPQNYRERVQMHINKFEDDALIKSILRGALAKFAFNKEQNSIKSQIKGANKSNLLTGSEEILKDNLSTAQALAGERQAVDSFLKRLKQKGARFKLSEVSKLNEFINEHNALNPNIKLHKVWMPNFDGKGFFMLKEHIGGSRNPINYMPLLRQINSKQYNGTMPDNATGLRALRRSYAAQNHLPRGH